MRLTPASGGSESSGGVICPGRITYTSRKYGGIFRGHPQLPATSTPSHSQAGSSQDTQRIPLCCFRQDGVLASVSCFVPEEKLKDAERKMKIIKMGTGCSN